MNLIPDQSVRAHTPTLLSTIKVPRRVSRNTQLKLPVYIYYIIEI